MKTEPEFSLHVNQQPYLSVSADRMDAVLNVTAGDLGDVASVVAAEVILLDCSGSMHEPMAKILAARAAAATAVDALRDGTYFAVVQGTDHAEMCYPAEPRMAVAAARTRSAAKERINAMVASGGTAMGSWLTLARELFATTPAAVRHAILLTDGKNRHETPQELERALAECAGRFCCDTRGIGTDWDPHELRRIAGVLRGTCDGVRREADLVDDFQEATRTAMAKVVPDLRLRVTPARGVELLGVKQVWPREIDYTGNPARVAGRVREFSTGSWAGRDIRDFQVSLRLIRDDQEPIGEDLNAALVELVTAGAADAIVAAPVVVHWTTDLEASSRIDHQVGHYRQAAELTRATLAGFDAYHAGRLDEARHHLGRARWLADQQNNAEAIRRLGAVVDVVDLSKGIVEFKPDFTPADMLRVGGGADSTSRAVAPVASRPVQQGRVPHLVNPCGHRGPPGNYCEKCGRSTTAANG